MMTDSTQSSGRVPLPLAVVGLAFLFGALRFEGFRPIGAKVIGIALPLGVVWAAQAKLLDTHPLLRRSALVLGAAVIVVSILQVGRLLLGVEWLVPHPLAYRLLLAFLGLAAVAIEALAARRSLRARVAAWFGIALGFAGYLSGVTQSPAQPLGLIFVAGLTGLWLGGGSGLLLGAGAARLVRRAEPEKAGAK